MGPGPHGPVLLLIAQLYRVEKQVRGFVPADRLRLREFEARPISERLHRYLTEIQAEVLSKNPEGRAIRYALKNWKALTRRRRQFGNRKIAPPSQHQRRGCGDCTNWMFFGRDVGGRTAAVLGRSFVASCERAKVDAFAWFQDVLSRIGAHPINRIGLTIVFAPLVQ